MDTFEIAVYVKHVNGKCRVGNKNDADKDAFEILIDDIKISSHFVNIQYHLLGL